MSRPRSRNRPGISRLCVLVLLLLAGGAIANVAVAWIVPRVGPVRVEMTGFRSNIEALERSDKAVGVLAEDATLIAFGLQRFQGLAMNKDVVYATSGTANRSITRLRCGWPMRSLAGRETTGVGLEDAVELPDLLQRMRFGAETFFVPIGVLWPGFAINTVFYAAVLWVVWKGPGVVRRRIRAMRGLCPACAYPVGTSPVCTECGTPVKVQRG